MKKYEIPWTVGSVFICNKCGVAFEKPEQAESLKKDLRIYLKQKEAHQKIRVMVGGCLNICEKEEQAVMYQPVQGETQVFTVDKNYETSLADLKNILDKELLT